MPRICSQSLAMFFSLCLAVAASIAPAQANNNHVHHGHHDHGHHSDKDKAPKSPVEEAQNTGECKILFEERGYCVKAFFKKGPVVGEESQMVIDFYSLDGKQRLEAPLPFKVYLWMPHHNHGSSPVKYARYGDDEYLVLPGRYLIMEMYFVMGGMWDVHVELTNDDGSKTDKSFRVNL